MHRIHPTAIVDTTVKLGDGVVVEAYAVVKGDVTLGAGTTIREHTIVDGPTIIGDHCAIGPGAFVGLDPQHIHFRPNPSEPTFLRIGNNVTIREASTIHRAIKPGLQYATTIGDGCFIMGQTHVAHDCVLANHVIMANGALMGGHCIVGDHAFLGGGSTLHQFCRIGRLAMIAGNEAVSRDIPPFATERYGGLKGYNAVGCRRAGMSREAIAAVRAAYLRFHTYRIMNRALAAIREEVPDVPEVREILEFIAQSKRGIQPSVKHLGNVADDSDD